MGSRHIKHVESECEAFPNEAYNSDSDLHPDNPEMSSRNIQLARQSGNSVGESLKEPGRNRKESSGV